MAPPFWTTPDQADLLGSWMPDFIRRQAEGKLDRFWPVMVESWFKKYPEELNLNLPLASDKNARRLTPAELATLGTALKARRKQLENWFRNHSKAIGNASPTQRASNAAIQRIFKMSVPKGRRVHQPVEIFQKRNTEAIASALTEQGYNDILTSDVPGEGPADRVKRIRAERMRLRIRVVRELWAEASAEEKKLVEEEIEAERKEIEEQGAMGGIDALDGVYSDIHKATYTATEWVGMSIFGGPNPRMGGQLTMKIICFGATPGGNDFEYSCVDFDKKITQPFHEFLKLCFTSDEAASWALPSTPDDEPDMREAQRVPIVTPVAPETTKSKSKSKSKSKKSKAKSAAVVEEPNDEDSSPDQIDDELLDFEKSLDEDLDEGELGTQSGRDGNIPDGGVDLEDGGVNLDGDDDNLICEEDLQDWTPPSRLWPAGMTAPLTPSEAAKLAAIERGVPDPAMMMIDPQLLNLSASGVVPGPTMTTTPLGPIVPIESLPPPKPAVPGKTVPAKKQPPPKKKSTAKVPAKEATAADAKKAVAKKPRGRPRKNSLGDITNLVLEEPGPTSTSTTPPPLTYSITNNNRARAREAAAASKAAQEKEAADARAKQAAKGWSERTVDGGTVLTLASTRARRAPVPARLPDGSLPVPKKTVQRLDACEIALLARAEAEKKTAGKRKATGTQASGRGGKKSLGESNPDGLPLVHDSMDSPPLRVCQETNEKSGSRVDKRWQFLMSRNLFFFPSSPPQRQGQRQGQWGEGRSEGQARTAEHRAEAGAVRRGEVASMERGWERGHGGRGAGAGGAGARAALRGREVAAPAASGNSRLQEVWRRWGRRGRAREQAAVRVGGAAARRCPLVTGRGAGKKRALQEAGNAEGGGGSLKTRR
ncbi:hypothetical protein DFH08DRAFT_806064 [Mycena albidolilacea]|uniref:Uncharacterized protein n=1 Tax=Mycena albidolilacea TaxID=1033008 RepID=A0AAD7A8G0_9AGAR|nr:hypothetical protein DFH08DRAFT_806064 [Mycena albidolilacea]